MENSDDLNRENAYVLEMQYFPQSPLPAPHRTAEVWVDTGMLPQHHLSLPHHYRPACLLWLLVIGTPYFPQGIIFSVFHLY